MKVEIIIASVHVSVKVDKKLHD